MRSPATTAQDEEESIGELFAQLIDDAGNMVRAELNLYRKTAFRHLVRARVGVILAVSAVLIAQASVTALLVGLVFGLARWLGPVGAGVVVAILGLAIGGLLLRAGIRRFSAATDFSDPAAAEKRA